MLQSANLADYKIFFENSKEFHTLKREIWGTDDYFIDIDKFNNPDSPVIVDLGAYIGLSSLYFDYNYSDALIYVFEPNPFAYEILMRNIKSNQLKNIKAFNLAIGAEEGVKNFFVDKTNNKWFSTGSFSQGAWNGKQDSKKIKVEVFKFSEVLGDILENSGAEIIDLMKMDIEGAEKWILKNYSAEFSKVKNLIVEWHGDLDEDKVAQYLKKGGHSIEKVVEDEGLFLIYSLKTTHA